MRALVLEALKKPLSLQDLPDPKPAEGEVIVDIKYAALNHRDVWIQAGKYPRVRLPVVLGSDGAGVHQQREVIINPGLYWGDDERVQSKNFQVLGMPRQGTFAARIAAPGDHVYPKPDHLSIEEAAALPLAGLTAYRALFARGRLLSGERVLITGAGGGVAQTAIQFALAAGAQLFVTSGNQSKIAQAKDSGVIGGVSYTEENWAITLQEQAGLFDLIIDSAGGDGFSQLIRLLKPAGRLVTYGGTVGKVNGISPQIIFWRQLNIMGSTMGSQQDFRDMLDFVIRHRISPVIDKVYTLEEGNAAFKRLNDHAQFGKIVLEISP